MSAEYKVRIYNRSSALAFEIVEFLALAYTKAVNAPGMAVITLPGNHAAKSALQLDWTVEVWRRDTALGVEWYRDFDGLFRDSERAAGEDGITYTTLYCPGVLSLLARNIIAYKTGVANRSAYTAIAAETICRSLVYFNATDAGSVADGRVRDVTGPYSLTVEADGAEGSTLDVSCAYQNLLSALQEVASVGGGDFDLVKTSYTAWQYRWYTGQLGTDRSAAVTFSLAYGNMTNPVLRRNSLDERTVAIVGGQGEEASRAIEARTGANYAADYNSVEFFVDARAYTTTAGLQAAGDTALWEGQARYSLDFEVLQTESCVYGSHYFLGDLVTAEFEEYSATKKITSIAIEMTMNGERIKVGVADV